MSEGGSKAAVTEARAGSAFHSRDFRLYQSARLMVIVGAEAQSVAVAWQVYAITHSALDLGFTGLALFLPGLLFVLAAGHVADRFDRRKIIMACYSLQAICTIVLLWLSLTKTYISNGRVWPIYAVLLGIGLGRAFSGPASSAMLPSLVPKDHFVNAVTWGGTINQAANMAGPTVGGLLFTLQMTGVMTRWNGAAIVYAFTLVMLVSFLILVGMIRTKMEGAVKKAFNAKTVLAGLEYVWKTKLLLGSISLDLFAVLLGGAVALLPIFATDILHAGPRGLGLLRAMPAVGALAVSLVMVIKPIKRNAGWLMLGCVGLFGAATIVFGLSRNIWISLIALVLVGGSDMVSVVIRGSVLQLATPPEMRGRVSAVNWIFIGASNEFGEFESGLTAHWWGAVRAVVVGGIGTLVVMGAAAAFFPALRQADALTAESLMNTELELSVAEPVD
ncbi:MULTISPECIES: MFS transporter [Acidobacteriaceae]|uniref:MFS transporter n=1 Tax=Acidobacteriaceae TaxID=204434 RepID=UPI00131BC6AF|nr:MULTISPECIES: MFS transporter [Acidobacteriaceae]MDW5266356.1 MFS transporter [Edaphobacter sp.]